MQSSFVVLAIGWLLVILVITIRCWKLRHDSVGIVLTYTILFGINHGLQGVIYAFPWYTPLYSANIVLSGYTLSFIALLSFGSGFVSLPFLHQVHLKISRGQTKLHSAAHGASVYRSINRWIPVIYIGLGLAAEFVFEPLFSKTATVSTAINVLQRLYHLGIVLIIWDAFTNKRNNSKTKLFIPMILTAVYPLFVLTNDGFLGQGLFPTMFILVFLAIRLGKRSLITLLTPCVMYIGLTIAVTYYAGRNDIRQVVWGGATAQVRADVVIDVFSGRLQAFDVFRQEHLQVIDTRLGLNWLVGLGIERLSTGQVSFAGGATYGDALLSILPRAIWPEKPSFVGGQTLVNQYTGVVLYGNTSVGLGQVLEAYVNFGILGVLVGFFGFGLLLSLMDKMISRSLKSDNFGRAALILMPFFSLWLIEDNSATVVASGVASILTVAILNTALQVVLSFATTNGDPHLSRTSIPHWTSSVDERQVPE